MSDQIAPLDKQQDPVGAKRSGQDGCSLVSVGFPCRAVEAGDVADCMTDNTTRLLFLICERLCSLTHRMMRVAVHPVCLSVCLSVLFALATYYYYCYF